MKKKADNSRRTNDDWWQYYEGYYGVDGQCQNVLLSLRRIRRSGKVMDCKSRNENSAYTHLWKSSEKCVFACALWQLTGPIQKLERRVYREVMYAPKWPQKRASRHEVISGIHLYNTKMAGIRRRNNIPQVSITNRHGMISRSGMVNALNDNHAPI